MSFLLDTNVVIGVLKGRRDVIARMRHHSRAEMAISAIAMVELWFGAFKSAEANALLARIQQIGLGILEFDEGDARCTGEIMSSLGRLGKPIGPCDGLIAGQALARDLTLVTHNIREFSRVPGLRLEDWEA